MLVLTRRPDESLIIDDKIIVKVLAVDGDKIKLGIEAPREIAIFRSELYEAVKEQERIAAVLASGPEPETFQKLRMLLIPEEKTASSENE